MEAVELGTRYVISNISLVAVSSANDSSALIRVVSNLLDYLEKNTELLSTKPVGRDRDIYIYIGRNIMEVNEKGRGGG